MVGGGFRESPLGGGGGNPVPIMLVGNKSDRIIEREVSTQEGAAKARELGCEFVEASAKNCVNVEKAFFDVVRMLKRQRTIKLKQPPLEDRNTRVNPYGNEKREPKSKRNGEKGKFRCEIL